MEDPDMDYVNLAEPGYFDFDVDGLGNFVFGALSGSIDCRFCDEKDNPRVEFTWKGESDMDLASGRGWFELVETNNIYGMLYVHKGEEAWLKAEKAQTG